MLFILAGIDCAIAYRPEAALPQTPLLYWLKCFTDSGATSGSHEARQLQLAMPNGPSPSQDQHSLPMRLTHGAVLTAVKLAHDAARAAAAAAEAAAESATAATAERAAAKVAETAAAAAAEAATAAFLSVRDVQEMLEMVMLEAVPASHEGVANVAGSAVFVFLTQGAAAGNAALDQAMLEFRQRS